MASLPLYRRLLGERFDALPEVLRRFHETPGGGSACGTFRVERGVGWLRNAVAGLLAMPEAGDEVPVRLRVLVEGDRERWIRDFHGRRVETVQWARGGLLMEAFGPTAFSCALVLEGRYLRYEFGRAWLAGLPLPRRFSPRVDGWVEAGEGGWRVSVRIVSPFLGPLVDYGGWMAFE